MARPEIQNIVMKKVWDYVKSYTSGIIFRKPDKELQEKLKQIHDILNPLFTKASIVHGIIEGEKLGSVRIARIGNIREIMSIVESV